MSSAPKLHHYVPQGYLKNFSTEKKKIKVIPLGKNRESYIANIRNVAAQNHFYTIEELEDSAYIEKELSKIESKALVVLQNLLSGEGMHRVQERWDLAYYFALQVTRGRDSRETLDYVSSSSYRLLLQTEGREKFVARIRKQVGDIISDAEIEGLWKEIVESEGVIIQNHNAVQIQTMLESARTITAHLALRPWVIVEFDEESLITSDSPVSLGISSDFAPRGFANAEGIWIPLARKIGLFMGDINLILSYVSNIGGSLSDLREKVENGALDMRISGNPELEKAFNGVTAASAKEFLYLHPEDEEFVPFKPSSVNLINVSVF